MDTDTTRLDAGHAPPATAEILEGLNDLLQLDHDAVGAYQIAMEKLHDRDHADQIAGFRRDHERHIRELNELIADLGGTPKNHPHATGPFKLALQSLGGLAGDKGVLLAFRANELLVRTKYDSYASKANHWPTNIKRVIDACALDEERHFRWVSDVLGKDENATLDPIDKAREKAAVAGHKLDAARERVADVAGTARERVADVAGTARERVAGGVDAVRNRIAGLTERTTPAGAGYTDEAYDGYPAGGPSRTADLRGRAQALAGNAGDTFEQRFNAQPLQTLLIAGIAGFVIGRLLR
ncbi:MAG TPA: ferritin-like domain-containing protein [Longimicrobium sp.]|nr:ferritin-like domain-containing protein [Longimicrobium sp.]